MVTQRRVSPEEEQRFYDATDLAALRPGWRGIGLARDARVQPYLWHWADVEPLVLRSGDIVTPRPGCGAQDPAPGQPQAGSGHD